MPINKLLKKVDAIENQIENISDNTGAINIYKEIIRSNRLINIICLVAIIALSIIIFLLLNREKDFIAYRENSVPTTEMIRLLQESNRSGG